MKALPESVRALLGRAAESEGPTPADRARIHDAFVDRLANLGIAAPPPPVPELATAAAAHVGWGALAAKLGLAGLALGASLWMVTQGSGPASETTSTPSPAALAPGQTTPPPGAGRAAAGTVPVAPGAGPAVARAGSVEQGGQRAAPSTGRPVDTSTAFAESNPVKAHARPSGAPLGARATRRPALDSDALSTRASGSSSRPGEAANAADSGHDPATATATMNAQPPGDGLRAELRILRAARAALDGDRPEVALRQLRRHGELFDRGLLREERLGLQVLATCASGATATGLRLRAAFLQASPRSILAGRVRTACQ